VVVMMPRGFDGVVVGGIGLHDHLPWELGPSGPARYLREQLE
jgi:hypothetical protein